MKCGLCDSEIELYNPRAGSYWVMVLYGFDAHTMNAHQRCVVNAIGFSGARKLMTLVLDSGWKQAELPLAP
jgi:hypothetical protein